MTALVGYRDQLPVPDLDLTRTDDRLATEQRRVMNGARHLVECGVEVTAAVHDENRAAVPGPMRCAGRSVVRFACRGAAQVAVAVDEETVRLPFLQRHVMHRVRRESPVRIV